MVNTKRGPSTKKVTAIGLNGPTGLNARKRSRVDGTKAPVAAKDENESTDNTKNSSGTETAHRESDETEIPVDTTLDRDTDAPHYPVRAGLVGLSRRDENA